MAKTAFAISDPSSADGPPPQAPADNDRVRQLVATHFDFIWRSLRRLGIPDHAVDDAVQKVFLVAARKIGPTPADGERAFLFAVALRVAAEERRALRRRHDAAGADEPPDLPDAVPSADDLVEQRQARALLDEIVREMPLELGVVFVLTELEEMTSPEIAELLKLPLGTIASRLRRGREAFDAAVARHQARARRGGVT